MTNMYGKYVENNKNKNMKDPKMTDPSKSSDYSYYSKLLQKPFDTVNELKRAEAAHLAELKAKEDKTAQRKADAKKVEDAFKYLNNARKAYKESLTKLTNTYTQDLKKLKADFESNRQSIHSALASAEDLYSKALKAFTDKYPEGYHLTLKDGDFETTLSSHTVSDPQAIVKPYTISELMDFIFNPFC